MTKSGTAGRRREQVERDRLAVVARYEILDSPPDGAFDRVSAIAARLFDVPFAIVSIVDRDRIWFKSHHGTDVEQIGRNDGLCASAILQYEPWLVTDARVDPRTLSNPLVAGERPEQAERLRALGCEHAQGSHFARPLPPTEMEQLLLEMGGRRPPLTSGPVRS